MSLSPRPAALERLTAGLTSLQNEAKDLSEKAAATLQKLAQFKAFVPAEAQKSIESRLSALAAMTAPIAAQKEVVAKIQARITEASEDKVSPLKVWKYFSSEQKDIRKNVNEIKDELDEARKALTALETQYQQGENEISGLQRQLSEFASFDPEAVKADHRALLERHAGLERAIAEAGAQVSALETRLKPQLEQFARAQTESRKIESDMAAAQRLLGKPAEEAEATAAESTRLFGMPSPADAIVAFKARQASLGQELAKLTALFEREVDRADTTTIDTLVLNGTTLLYAGSQFLGWSALESVITALKPSYRLILILDPELLKLLGRSAGEISSLLGDQIDVQLASGKDTLVPLLEATVKASAGRALLVPQGTATNVRAVPFLLQQDLWSSPDLGVKLRLL